MIECKMKAVNQHQLQLKEQAHVHVYDGQNSKSMHTTSDEKVYCFLSHKAVYNCCLEYRVLIGNILMEFQENWHV